MSRRIIDLVELNLQYHMSMEACILAFIDE